MPTAADPLGPFPPGSRLDDDGTLIVDGCRLDDVAARFGTPSIVVSEGALRRRARGTWPRSAAGGRAPTSPSRRSRSRARPFSGS